MTVICMDARLPTKEEVAALKALAEGKADARQQRLSIVYICNTLCRTHDLLYVPGDADQTAFLNGRGFVGNKILKILKIPTGKLDVLDDEEKAPKATRKPKTKEAEK